MVDEVAEKAYLAFVTQRDTLPEYRISPAFRDLPPEVQQCWKEACQAVVYYVVSSFESTLQYDGFDTE